MSCIRLAHQEFGIALQIRRSGRLFSPVLRLFWRRTRRRVVFGLVHRLRRNHPPPHSLFEAAVLAF